MEFESDATLPHHSVPHVWLTREDVADRLLLSKSTLESWAVTGQGPRFAKFGGRVRYRLADVIAWEDARFRN